MILVSVKIRNQHVGIITAHQDENTVPVGSRLALRHNARSSVSVCRSENQQPSRILSLFIDPYYFGGIRYYNF